MLPRYVKLNGYFDEQKGTARRGRITGYNAECEPCRIYTWINPKLPELKGKKFEAFDSQIINALAKGGD